MVDPKVQLQELQNIQQQIIAFIDEYTENARDDDLAKMLRMAVTDLNDAKCIIGDRAVAAGTLKITDSSDGSHLKNPDDDDAKAS